MKIFSFPVAVSLQVPHLVKKFSSAFSIDAPSRSKKEPVPWSNWLSVDEAAGCGACSARLSSAPPSASGNSKKNKINKRWKRLGGWDIQRDWADFLAGWSLVCEVDDDLTEALMGACKGSASSSTSRARREMVAPARRLLTESMPSSRYTEFVINDSLNLSRSVYLQQRGRKGITSVEDVPVKQRQNYEQSGADEPHHEHDKCQPVHTDYTPGFRKRRILGN